ncbi:hypothetical protein MIMGU_mgv11b0163501mg, partial [Erythranthe guttata]
TREYRQRVALPNLEPKWEGGWAAPVERSCR